MLDPFSRGTIIAMSVVCVASAVALAPVRVRGSNDPIAFEHAPIAAPALPQARDLGIAVTRDPFSGPPTAAPATTPAAMASSALSALPVSDAGPLPSNIAGSTIPAVPGGGGTASTGTARVTAIVTGPHPYAMIDTAGLHEIKGLGDRIGGASIVAIDINGITLQGGQRLTVSPQELSQ